MDDLSFGLSEPARILHATGVRHLFPAHANALDASAPTTVLAGSDENFASCNTERHGSAHAASDDYSSMLLEDPWKGFLAKIPSYPRTVWTYWELGTDFGGAADQRRSQLLRRLVGALEWPKGSVGFWPCTVLERGVLAAQCKPFLAGIRRIQPPSLVVFGQDRFATLFGSDPHALVTLSQQVSIFYAPPIVNVLDFAQDQMETLLSRLKQFYSSIFPTDVAPSFR